MSNDPVGVVGHFSTLNGLHGFNRYAYANNNPYKYTDPTGMNSECPEPCNTVKTIIELYKTAITEIFQNNESSEGAEGTQGDSPEIDPGEVAGKSPEEIEKIAGEKGLESKGPNPKSGEGAYVDPVTGKQRILVHPDADCGPHCHVNDPEGNRLDEEGNKVPPDSPEAHLPLR